MSVITILFAILFLCMGIVGEEKGMKSFFALVLNFIIIFILLKKITVSSSPVLLTLVFCGIMSSITLFIINGFHRKTTCALASVGIIIVAMLLIISPLALRLNIQGFDYNQSESIEYLSINVNLPFAKLVICEMLVGVFSAITDTAITISSSMNEILLLSPCTSRADLFKSGMNIGSDILGTTVNTLFFVCFGNMVIILIWFITRGTSFGLALNSKLLDTIIFDIIISGISVLLIIPVSSFVSSYILMNKKKA